MNLQLILTKALQFRPAAKIQLIEKLIESIKNPDNEVEQIWAEESEKRYQALKEGRVATIPIEQIAKRHK